VGRLLEDEDSGGVVGAPARREAGFAHSGLPDDVVDQLEGVRFQFFSQSMGPTRIPVSPLSIPKFCQCHASRGLSNLPSMKQRPRPLGRRDKGKNFGDFQSNVEIFGCVTPNFGLVKRISRHAPRDLNEKNSVYSCLDSLSDA
jgi:hypothetical protein